MTDPLTRSPSMRRLRAEPVAQVTPAPELGADEPAEVGDDTETGSRHVGSYDLEQRHALRRVPGLATELTDVTEVEYRQLRLERVVLVGVWTSGTLVEAELSLVELAR